MLLRLENVTVHHGRVEALKGVSLAVGEGEIVAMMGANGAGKTTLVRSISGLSPLTSGKIWLNDARMDRRATSDIVKMGVATVPEGRRLFPYMTVLGNLRIGAYVRKDKREIERDLEQVFEYFPILKERTNQSASTLSGGQQQMLAIGRALMARPTLLVVDELSLGLSPILVENLSKILKDLNREGLSVLLVEQNAYMALQVAHRGYILETGSIVIEGNARDLMNDEHVRKAYIGG